MLRVRLPKLNVELTLFIGYIVVVKLLHLLLSLQMFVCDEAYLFGKAQVEVFLEDRVVATIRLHLKLNVFVLGCLVQTVLALCWKSR